MSSHSVALAVEPLPAPMVGRAEPSPAQTVGSTPLVDLFARAFVRCDVTNQQAAGMLDISPSDYSKAFSVNWPERNPLMKRFDKLPFEIRRDFAVLLSADYQVPSSNAEHMRILSDFAKLLQVVR